MASKSAPSSIVLTQIFSSFGIYTAPAVLEPISSGLIHSTWKIMNESDAFVLQRVNKAVFADPEAVCNNARLLSQYLTARDPTYLFICPLVTASGRMTLDIDGETYRMLPFVKNSCVYEVAISPEIAGAAARSFGRLTFMLSDFDCSNLHVSIPRFHDISLRYQQFEGALVEGDRQRIEKSSGLIEFLKSQKHIVDAYFDLLYDPNFKIRVTHHDTKISNVLFDATDSNRALCVIDLDTLMPGYFISDIGGK